MPTGPRAIRPQASVWFGGRVPGSAQRRRAATADAGAAGAVRRADQPAGLDLPRIVRATVLMLDAQGLARFSMRRLAAELGVTPMSLYWYVDNKDDLLEIALDEVGGEVPVPRDGPEADWREQLRWTAASYRRMLVGHPWASRLIGEYMNVGPKATAFSAGMQAIMRRTGLPDEMIPGALGTVHQFVYGFGTVEGRWQERCRTAGVHEDELFDSMSEVARDHPGFHGLAEYVERRGRGTLAELRERDFAFALECLIAGIEAMRDRARRDG
jgi:AcrR family transcriptional regulator